MRIVICCVLAAFVISGCGAIVHGKFQDITVNSSPSAGKALISGEEKTTPATFNLRRSNSYIVKISKEGYEPAEVMINRKLDWTAWADLFLWGVIPIFYDLSSGAAYKLTPDEISVTLQRSIGNLDGPEKSEVKLSLEGNQLIAKDSGLTITITPKN